MTKRFSKSLSLVLCLLMIISAFGPAFGATSTSDYESHWAKAAIQSAIDSGISKGYPDGSFKPDNAITRAEFFALVNNAFNFTDVSPVTYTDVPVDVWYWSVIAKAKAAGYISGYSDGTIHPNSNITRQEAAIIISRVKSLTATSDSISFTDASSIADWSKQAVIAVFEAKVMSGYPDGSFKPNAQIKRAEALVSVNNSLNYNASVDTESTDTVYDKAGKYGSAFETVTIEGNVVIKAAGITLENTIVKGNLTIAKEVGDGDVTLKSVVVLGDTYVNGGGENSIYFINVTTGKVIVQKDDGPVRIVASGTSVIAELTAKSDIKLEEVDMTGAGFEGITVEKTVDGGIEITLTGVKCESIKIEAEGVTLTADKESTVKTLTIDAEDTKIKGEVVIEKAEVKADGVTFEKAPTETTTAKGVETPTVKAPSTGGGGGGGGSSSSATTTVAVSAITNTLVPVAGTTTKTVTTTPTDATVAAVSGTTGVATVSVTGHVVTVTGVSAGTSTITVTGSKTGYTSAARTFVVTVTEAGSVALEYKATGLGMPTSMIAVYNDDAYEVIYTLYFDGNILATADNGAVVVATAVLKDLTRIEIDIAGERFSVSSKTQNDECEVWTVWPLLP